jgi:hypothetical protein
MNLSTTRNAIKEVTNIAKFPAYKSKTRRGIQIRCVLPDHTKLPINFDVLCAYKPIINIDCLNLSETNKPDYVTVLLITYTN